MGDALKIDFPYFDVVVANIPYQVIFKIHYSFPFPLLKKNFLLDLFSSHIQAPFPQTNIQVYFPFLFNIRLKVSAKFYVSSTDKHYLCFKESLPFV